MKDAEAFKLMSRKGRVGFNGVDEEVEGILIDAKVVKGVQFFLFQPIREGMNKVWLPARDIMSEGGGK